MGTQAYVNSIDPDRHLEWAEGLTRARLEFRGKQRMKFYLCDSASTRLHQLDREIGIRRAHPEAHYPENALDLLYKKWLAGVRLFQAATETTTERAHSTNAPAANSSLRTISAAAAQPELGSPVASTTDKTEPIEQPVWHGIPPPLPQKFRDLRSQAAQRLCEKYERLRVECSDVSSELEAIYHASIDRSSVQLPRVVKKLTVVTRLTI
jgi:hypothetical protein